MVITRTFTVPRKFYPRIIMIDALIKRLKATMKKTKAEQGCLFTVYFTTDAQAELFDSFMQSILSKEELY